MAVNQALSQVSDLAFQAAMAGYVVALVCHGVEFASRRVNAPARAATASSVTSAARGATALLTRPDDDADPAGGVGSTRDPDDFPWAGRFGWAGVVVTLIGFAAQVVSIAARGMAVGRAPWGNMYEFSSMITAATVAVWLVMLVKTRARSIGLFVMFPVTVLVFLGGTVLYTRASSLVPALQSYWLVIHVLAVSLSSGVLLFSGVASLLLIARHRYDSRALRTGARTGGSPGRRIHAGADGDADRASADDGSMFAGLPSVQTLDRIAYRTAIIAFPVFTFAVVAGSLWAEAAWGRYWGWDPKETCAFITWVIYACYLHARATAGWRGVRSAWISILGFISILFNLFFVNMVISGLHSYAGLN